MQLSRDYSTKRTAFGKYLADHPLHMQTLARMEVGGLISSTGFVMNSLSLSLPPSLSPSHPAGRDKGVHSPLPGGRQAAGFGGEWCCQLL